LFCFLFDACATFQNDSPRGTKQRTAFVDGVHLISYVSAPRVSRFALLGDSIENALDIAATCYIFLRRF
jgi:hypothetical protein